MTEQAGIWQRVSTGGQDEASQLPDNLRWCATHAYNVAKRYVLHGKSASKGKQDKALDEVIRDMQDGVITVLVVWQSSRIERRGAYNAFDLARRVKQAGGRIEYVKDAFLNDTNEMSDVMLALAATKDRQKSRDITLQVTAKQEANRERGSANGRAAWGYAVAQRGSVKVFSPTDAGREWAPWIFDMVINGVSGRDIAEGLTDRRVAPMSDAYVIIGPLRPWNEAFISKLIKNPIYYGQRRNGGQLKTEALVLFSVWQEANAALTSRHRPGRATSVREKAMQSPVCGNPACDATGAHPSPMYRATGGSDGYLKDYYRCTGRGPQRRGCGNMVPLAELDSRVIDAMVSDDKGERYEREFIPGDDRADEIGKLRESAMTAYRRGDKAAFLDLDAQADALAEMRAVPSRWEMRGTGITHGDYFAGLDADGRRNELATRWSVSAYCDSAGEVIPVISQRDLLAA